MKIDIKVQGAEAAAGLMRGAADGISGTCAEGLMDGLTTMMDDAMGLVPVDTGRLRISLEAKAEPTGQGASGRLSANTDYALFVEMGTGATGAASNGDGMKAPTTGAEYVPDHPGMAAQPYLYPAYQANRDTLTECVANAILRRLGV